MLNFLLSFSYKPLNLSYLCGHGLINYLNNYLSAKSSHGQATVDIIFVIVCHFSWIVSSDMIEVSFVFWYQLGIRLL